MVLDHSIRESSVLEIIEELEPLRSSRISIGGSSRVTRVTHEPQGLEIPFVRKNDVVEFTVDEFLCHQMIVLHEASA